MKLEILDGKKGPWADGEDLPISVDIRLARSETEFLVGVLYDPPAGVGTPIRWYLLEFRVPDELLGDIRYLPPTVICSGGALASTVVTSEEHGEEHVFCYRSLGQEMLFPDYGLVLFSTKPNSSRTAVFLTQGPHDFLARWDFHSDRGRVSGEFTLRVG